MKILVKKPRGMIGCGIVLPPVSKQLSDWLEDKYTIPNPEYENALRFTGYAGDIPKTLYFATWKKNRLTIPRGFNLITLPDDLLAEWLKIDFEDCRTNAECLWPERSVECNKQQEILLEAFKRTDTKDQGTFLFVAPTSSGKTIAQALVAAHTRQRTLVLCPTNLIKDSWYRDLNLAFGLKREDIGLLQGQTWKIKDPITIGSVMTLIRRKHLWNSLFNQFGCVVVDEAHLISAPQLWEFLSQCPAKYIIGMTATNAKPGAVAYLNALFGKPVKQLFGSQSDTENSLALKRVRVIKTDFTFESQLDNFDFHGLWDKMLEDDARNSLVLANVVQDWKKGRSVLITTHRVDHAKFLWADLQDRGITDANLLIGETNTNKKKSALLINSVLSRSVRCVVATTKAIMLGANLNPLDSLHIAMPITNVTDLEQLIGRIRRRAEGKETNCCTYYYDHRCSYLRRKYADVAMAVFRKLKVPGFEDVYIA